MGVWCFWGVFVVYGLGKGGIKVVRNICYQPCINRVFTVFSPTDAADEQGIVNV